MRKCLILLFILICSMTQAKNIIRLGESNPKARKLGESATRAKVLKASAAPKQKQSASKKQDIIKDVIDAPFRKWTSQNGNSIKAQLKGLSQNLAVFEIKDGKKIKVARNKLAFHDQEYLNHYDKTGEFPAKDLTKTIIFSVIGMIIFIVFAKWFVGGNRKRDKYQTPKRNIKIGTGI